MTESLRLPETVMPLHYNLLFDVNLGKFEFSGKEEITLEITKPTTEIILNTHNLKIKRASLVIEESLKPKIKLRNKKELLFLKFDKLVEGSAKLILEFEGIISDDLTGFYKSKYKDKKEKYWATTQFEPHYARRMFPCFDEPAFKATFDVAVKIDKNLQAVSNMPIKDENIENNKKTITFDKSPLMSTYLLYLGIGNFEFLDDKYKNVLLRVVTTPGKKEQGKFALDLTKKFLAYFEEYSGIPYPLPKLDLIALPDFAMGAMENWGAITFRELILLFDPNITSIVIKKRIAETVAHELWHQWSGNLVTMKWWNDLWLNESFATYVAFKAVDHFFPEWKFWEDFISEETDAALNDDYLKNTHPIEVEIKQTSDIEEAFDEISYNKGGSILRMLDNYLGEETFRKGVSKYLSKYKYKNATSEDLWNSLAEVSDKPVKDIMISWVKQAGYPLIESELKDNTLILKQQKFMFKKKDTTTWLVPMLIQLNNKSEPIAELFDSKEKEIKLDQQPKWYNLNYKQVGFYVTKYPKRILTKLQELIADKSLLPEDRWGMHDNLYRLSKHGKVKLDFYLDFIKSYKNEDNYLVLGDIYGVLDGIHFIFSKENYWPEIWPKFKLHFKGPFEKLLTKLCWEPKEGESQSDTLLRRIAISYLAFIEDDAVNKKGLELFDSYVKTKKIHPNIRSPVLGVVALTNKKELYEKVLDMYLTVESPEEKRALLATLGSFDNADLLKRTLDFGLTDKVRLQDLPILIGAVSSNVNARDILITWFEENWQNLEKYQKTGKLFVHILESFVSCHVGKDAIVKLKQFFAKHPVEYKKAIKQSLERVERNTLWFEKNRTALEKYFKK